MLNGNELFKLIPASELRETDTIFDGLNLLKDGYEKIVVIVNDEGKFRGIVSSGDLRKSILNGNSLSTQLRFAMNKEPVYIKYEELRKSSDINSHILNELRQRYGEISMFYAMVPVISDDRRVLGLINLESLMNYVFSPTVKLNCRTVLIVGGAGFIGSVLTRKLLSDGWSVRVLDRLLYSEDSLKGLEKEKFTLIRGDAGCIDDIVKAVEGVDAVIYLAELVGDPACSLAPQSALKTNYLAVMAMAHLCSHLNISRFIYTSSCSVYGASTNSEEFLREGSSLNPVSLYARIKVLSEEAILSVCNLPNPLFAPTILRLGTVFGYSYRQRFDLVVNAFVKNALQKGAIEVFGGDQWRPHIHVKDVAEAIAKVLNAPIEDVGRQIFNVGDNQGNLTINDLADIAKEVFPNIKIVKKDDVVDQRNYRVDFSKINKVLGFQAKIGIKEGMVGLKDAFESKKLEDLDDSKYSNFKRLKELNLV